MVDVRDNAESGVTCRRAEESLMDENVNSFYTILVGETIESSRGKLEVLKDKGRDTYGVFKSSLHFSLLTKPPISLSLSSGVQKIFLFPRESL